MPRADAAAAGVLRLVPPAARTLLDLACGTGLVTERLVRPGLRVYGADAATTDRRPGRSRPEPPPGLLGQARLKSITQFVTHSPDPSGANACSQRAARSVIPL